MKTQVSWKDNATNETAQDVIVKFQNNGVDPTPATMKFPVAADVETTEIEIPVTTPHICEISVAARNANGEAVSSDKYITATQFPNQFLMSEFGKALPTSAKKTRVTEGPDAAGKNIPDYDSDFNTNGSFSAQTRDGVVYSFTPNRIRKFDKDFVPTNLVDALSKNACPHPPAVTPDGTVYTLGQRAALAEIFVHKNDQFERFIELSDGQTQSILNSDCYPVVLLDGTPVWVAFSTEYGADNGNDAYVLTFHVVDVATKTMSVFRKNIARAYKMTAVGVLASGEIFLRGTIDGKTDFVLADVAAQTIRTIKSDKDYPDLSTPRCVVIGTKIAFTGDVYDENNDRVPHLMVVDLSGATTYSAVYIPLSEHIQGGISNPVLLPSGTVISVTTDMSNGKLAIVSLDIESNTHTVVSTHHDNRGHLCLMRIGSVLRALSESSNYVDMIIEQPRGIAQDDRFNASNVGCGLPARSMVL